MDIVLTPGIVIALALLLGLGGLLLLLVKLYTVVDPNEAHVVVLMGRGRRVYSPSNGNSSAYFYIPFFMKRFVLPLINQKIEIPDIHLNDKEVAPFICDVVSWLRIQDPIMAGERLNLSNPFGSLRDDLIPIVQAVARTGAMKQEILDIMRDRETFATSVSAEVRKVLTQWGVELVNLDINDIRDDQSKQSSIVSDYEDMRKAQVEALSRKEIAKQEREAIEVEQENTRLAEIAKAEAEEQYMKRQIERDKTVGIEIMKKNEEVSLAQNIANQREIEALDTLEVGKANVNRRATVEQAEGEAEAQFVKGKRAADVVKLEGVARADVVAAQGKAEGAAIEAKGTAEAAAKDKMADAMSKYNKEATGIEQIRAVIEIEQAKYNAIGQIAKNANIDIVQSGEGANLFGVPLNASTGADFGQMLKGLGINAGDVAAAVASKVTKK